MNGSSSAKQRANGLSLRSGATILLKNSHREKNNFHVQWAFTHTQMVDLRSPIFTCESCLHFRIADIFSHA